MQKASKKGKDIIYVKYYISHKNNIILINIQERSLKLASYIIIFTLMVVASIEALLIKNNILIYFIFPLFHLD